MKDIAKNIILTALITGMFLMGPMYTPMPAVPRQRIEYIQDFKFDIHPRHKKRFRNHYRRYN